jgi:arginine decarboxylase
MNYSLQEYANNVVYSLSEACREHGLPQPHIVSESGRAMTAHHAVLITNVVDTESIPEAPQVAAPGGDDPGILHDMWDNLEALRNGRSRSVTEAYHDVVNWLAEAQTMYTHGLLGLEQRARSEMLYYATCLALRERLNPASRNHRLILDELNEKLAHKYFCNFSLFQSLPDVWAIDQIFPVLPLHRLDEAPRRRVVLQDITCDSDGRIDRYVDGEGLETSLPAHAIREGEPYLLGFFLVGAYQEILGDMHNLFGDTNSVNVELGNGGYRLSHPTRGDGVDAVLRYVRIDVAELEGRYRDKIAASDLGADRREACLNELVAGLTGYTYLED